MLSQKATGYSYAAQDQWPGICVIPNIFRKLDVSQITKVNASIDVKNLIMRSLPNHLDYYYYEGSLTTPDYDEIVQWFVLKDPIVLPTSYVEDLREIEYGSHLTFNFRDTQDLTDRTVLKFEV